LAGDKNLCDNKWIVTLSDVILSGFDCMAFGLCLLRPPVILVASVNLVNKFCAFSFRLQGTTWM